MLPRLHGAFALAIAFRQHPDLLIGARLGSPLVVGYGEGETYLGSDALALAPLTQRIAYLEEGDWVVITRDGRADLRQGQQSGRARRSTHSGASAVRDREGQLPPLHAEGDLRAADRRRADAALLYPPARRARSRCRRSISTSPAIKRVTIVACGTSYYAGMVAKYWFEQFARVPVDIDVASEFRYRDPVLEEGGLALFISQSGETADTLAALRHCKAEGQTIAVVVNVPTSSMAREADLLLPTHAGPEIGVASTKAFTCQLAVLAALAAHLAVARRAG